VFRSDLSESFAGILEQEGRFGIGGFSKHFVDGFEGMSVEDEQVHQTIVVVIEEARAKATHHVTDFAKSQLVGGFVEVPLRCYARRHFVCCEKLVTKISW